MASRDTRNLSSVITSTINQARTASTDSRTETERALDDALRKIDELGLKDELAASKAREAELASELGSKDKEIAELQKEIERLKAGTVTLVADDTVSLADADVKRSLRRISQTVEDLTSEFVGAACEGKEEISEALLNADHVAMVQKHRLTKHLAEELVKVGVRLDDLLLFGTASLICLRLQREVFDHFKPGLKDAEGQFMQIAVESVRLSEAQDTYANWRSTLYNRVFPMPPIVRSNLSSHIADKITTSILEFYTSLQVPSTSFQQAWTSELATLALNCLHWHDMTKGKILDWDYETVLHTTTEVQDRLVAVNGFGLVKKRMVKATSEEGENIVEEVVELVKVPGVKAKDLRERVKRDPEGEKDASKSPA